MEWFLLIGGIMGVVIAGFYVLKKRREQQIKGWQSAMTSICFLTIALLISLTSFFELLGIVTWALTILLLMVGAYFTKYIPSIKMLNGKRDS